MDFVLLQQAYDVVLTFLRVRAGESEELETKLKALCKQAFPFTPVWEAAEHALTVEPVEKEVMVALQNLDRAKTKSRFQAMAQKLPSLRKGSASGSV